MEPLFRLVMTFCVALIIVVALLLFFLLTGQQSLAPSLPQIAAISMVDLFEQEIAAYAAIDRGPLRLKDDSLMSFTKKLQKKLHYLGPCSRPDSEKGTCYLSLDEPFVAKVGTPLYLSLDKQRQLKIETTKHLATRVYMTIEQEEVKQLLVKVFATAHGQLLGEFRLIEEKLLETDNPLFSQKMSKNIMRLVGADLFLQKHGGESYATERDKERFDFGSVDAPKAFFLKAGDCLVFEEGVWCKAETLGTETQKKWLLQVDSLDERTAHLTLWPTTGDQKFPLHLPRIIEGFTSPPIEKSFKYLGSKSRSKWLFELDKERVIITPGSWWLYTQGKWHELADASELDMYVNSTVCGELLVFDDLIQNDDGKFLEAHLFNRLRNQIKDIKISIQ